MVFVVYQNSWGEVTGAIPCANKKEAVAKIAAMVDEIAFEEGCIKDLRVYTDNTHIITTPVNKHRIQISV